jgi:hypothetical protein
MRQKRRPAAAGTTKAALLRPVITAVVPRAGTSASQRRQASAVAA